MYKHLFTFYFGMLQIFLVQQSLLPFEKFCLWALVFANNVSVAVCQFVNFVHLVKNLITFSDFISVSVDKRGWPCCNNTINVCLVIRIIHLKSI